VGAEVAALALWQRRPLAFLASLTASALLFLGMLAAAVAPLFDAVKAPRALVALAGAQDPHRDLRIGIYQIGNLPSLNFYTRRHVRNLLVESQVHEFLASPVPAYLFVPESAWKNLEGRVCTPHRQLGSHPNLYGAGRVIVVTNQ
jgi:hypothetical protein